MYQQAKKIYKIGTLSNLTTRLKPSCQNNKHIKFSDKFNVSQGWKLEHTSCLVTLFSKQTKNYGENLQLRAKTETNKKTELKMEVVSNICDKEVGGEMKSINENYFKKILENFQK